MRMPALWRKRAERFVFASLLLLVAAGTALAEERRLLVLGDSLSAAYGLRSEQGWVALLQQRLDAELPGWRVINASVSGETTAGGAARIAGELERNAPDLVVLQLGANDGLRGLPLEHAESNLSRITEAAQLAGAEVLLVGIRIPPNYGPDYAEGLVALYPKLAQRYDTGLLPFLLEPIAADREAFLPDNLHPTADVQPQLMEHVWSALQPMLEQRQERGR